MSPHAEDSPSAGHRCGPAATVVLAASGVLIVLTLVGWWSDRPPGPLLALDITVGVLSWLATPLMLWRPLTGTAVATVLAVLSPAATPPATMGTLQVAHRRRFPVAAAVAVAGIAAHAVQGAWRSNGGMSYGWWLVLVSIAYGALLGWGAWAQAHEALIRSLHERARRAEAEQGRRVAEARLLERRRIAREMHDVLAHRLSLLATFAGAMEYRPDSSPEQLSRAAGVVRDGVHQALDELREVISLLRDDDPGADGDGTRPQPVLADVPRLVEESRNAGTDVLLREAVDDPAAAPPSVARTAYRVIQEGLTNARKHAAGQRVWVDLRGGPGVGLEVDVRNPLAAHDPLATHDPPNARNPVAARDPLATQDPPNGRDPVAARDPLAGRNPLAACDPLTARRPVVARGPLTVPDPAAARDPLTARDPLVARDPLSPERPAPPGWAGGAGLVGLTERVQLAGGRLDHQALDGEFRLHASLPWPA